MHSSLCVIPLKCCRYKKNTRWSYQKSNDPTFCCGLTLLSLLHWNYKKCCQACISSHLLDYRTPSIPVPLFPSLYMQSRLTSFPVLLLWLWRACRVGKGLLGDAVLGDINRKWPRASRLSLSPAAVPARLPQVKWYHQKDKKKKN